ncbi:MAG: PEP/pyruvate-binding domain-containing protein, partial [Thermodesulfobacteriota bacterium]
MALVPAKAAGITFSRDPGDPEGDMLVSAVWGLGKLVVDGTADPDRYWVGRTFPPEVRRAVVGHKDQRLEVAPGGGVRLAQVEGERPDSPCLTGEQVVRLAEVQQRLETLLGGPLDTEWVLDPTEVLYVVQSRPLALKPSGQVWREIYPGPELDRDYRPLVEGLQVASPGAACGRAVFLERPAEMNRVSAGSVIVVTDATPKLVNTFPKATALLAEKGSSTGHLAIIAREFHVPVLVGLSAQARERLTAEEEITVDAYTGRVFSGRVRPLLEMASALREGGGEVETSPSRRLLEEVLGHVTPLNLIDPRSPVFRPQSIKTIHDVIRFAHETAINTMFEINDSRPPSKGLVKRLVSEVPLDIYIIDLGQGLRDTGSVRKVQPEDITSIPFLALYRGMTTPGVRWSGHIPIDFKGFVSVFANTLYDASKYERRLGDRSYAIVSQNYLNFSSRLGYHFSIVDAYSGEVDNDNYISFRFKGGAASLEKRARRVRFIEAVLERHGFWVDRKADLVNARIKRLPREEMEEKLVMLGRLMGCSRQLDVTMLSEAKVLEFVQRFTDGDFSMGFGAEGDESLIQ